jgi:hypothetical protein
MDKQPLISLMKALQWVPSGSTQMLELSSLGSWKTTLPNG